MTTLQQVRARPAQPLKALCGWSVRHRDRAACTDKALASSKALDEYFVGTCETSMLRRRPAPLVSAPLTSGRHCGAPLWRPDSTQIKLANPESKRPGWVLSAP
ncbi:hypothetical protein QTP88_007431 [Uroleucon formosanum]